MKKSSSLELLTVIVILSISKLSFTFLRMLILALELIIVLFAGYNISIEGGVRSIIMVIFVIFILPALSKHLTKIVCSPSDKL